MKPKVNFIYVVISDGMPVVSFADKEKAESFTKEEDAIKNCGPNMKVYKTSLVPAE